MVDATAQLTIVIEEVSPVIKLDDRVVSCPSQNGLENASAVRERTHWALAGPVAEEVCVASGVGEVVGVILLM